MTEPVLYRDDASATDAMERAATDGVMSSDGDGRTIEVRLVTWGEVANTPQGREAFVRGAFDGIPPERVMLESGARMVPPNGTHAGAVIVGAATALESRADGQYATFRVAPTAAGDELMGLVSGPTPVLRDASVVFRPRPGGSRQRADGVIERTAAELFRVGIVERGAYRTSQVVAVRSAGTETTRMHCNICGQEHATGVTCPVTATAQAAASSAVAPVLERMDATDAALAAAEDRIGVAIAAAALGGAGRTPSPLAEYASLGEYSRAAYSGPSAYGSVGEGDMLARALADQLFTDSENEGLSQPAWLSGVAGIVNLGRRVVNAFGGPRPLPPTGMSLMWPTYVGSNMDGLVGEQATQKTEVTTRKVSIADATSAIKTYAGGSDIAYQTLQRSTPSYREIYDRIMLAAWAKESDAAFATALEAASGTTTQTARGVLGPNLALTTSAATDDIIDFTPDHGFTVGDAIVFTSLTGGTGLVAGRVYWVTETSLGAKTLRVALTPGGAAIGFTTDITAGNAAKVTDTGTRIRAALFEASVAIEDATGAPASAAVAGTDVFLMLAGMSGIVPLVTESNPSNASGLAEASTLRMEVSGLTIVRSPAVSKGKVLVSNPLAAGWYEDGPKWATAEDVAKLGQNVAVYSFAAPAITVPAGIVELTLI